jgi:hypothetical protein
MMRSRNRNRDTHLRMVQFIFSDYFHGNLSASLSVDSLVDIGESTVTHLLNESETLESLRVSFERPR